MSQVRDIVDRKELHYVDENDTVANAARRMEGLHAGAILVLHQGELRGVFSERDLMRRVVLEKLDPETTPVRQVMSTDLSTIEDSATVEEAMEAMRARNCRHLPVMHDGRVKAFLSMRDLMNFELERKTEEVQHMRAYIQSNT